MRTGRDQYSAIYSAQLDAEAKWLAIGAVEKANSIERLVSPRISHPKRIVELGAGTGAIIAELQRRNFADAYVAVDYSTDATEYMRRNLTNVEVLQADIVEEPVGGTFDVVVISHVLEHLESPDTFLAALVRNLDFRFAVIECPLEKLAASQLKNLFRDRYQNLAGHVQFFNRRSLSAVVRRHLKIIRLQALLFLGICRDGALPCRQRRSPMAQALDQIPHPGGFAAGNVVSLEAVLDRQLRVAMSEIMREVFERNHASRHCSRRGRNEQRPKIDKRDLRCRAAVPNVSLAPNSAQPVLASVPP
jgi:2-polyprenyl-3-methyl-5-hydroxy-6-metoxy-1,4-benzoquinol methylase